MNPTLPRLRLDALFSLEGYRGSPGFFQTRAFDPAGEFIERGSSGVNSCCAEDFLLWEKAEEEPYVGASPAVHCSSSSNCRWRALHFLRVTSLCGCVTRSGGSMRTTPLPPGSPLAGNRPKPPGGERGSPSCSPPKAYRIGKRPRPGAAAAIGSTR